MLRNLCTSPPPHRCYMVVFLSIVLHHLRLKFLPWWHTSGADDRCNSTTASCDPVIFLITCFNFIFFFLKESVHGFVFSMQLLDSFFFFAVWRIAMGPRSPAAAALLFPPRSAAALAQPPALASEQKQRWGLSRRGRGDSALPSPHVHEVAGVRKATLLC